MTERTDWEEIERAVAVVATDGSRSREAYLAIIDVVEKAIAAAEKRKVVEIRGIIEGEKYTSHLETAKRHPTVPWNECEACIQNYHYNMALDRILSLLQADNNTEV